ncbi:hypothetical protein Taro_020572 [Colocasia esculenta]|uniref:Pentatricopeptide repeat-containing protein n=1 Tax=Colocasia esculenta TaxID=4460 RepID=A0A843V012_COLES|nr:hypothetical protein [Colocasia esculenta]
MKLRWPALHRALPSHPRPASAPIASLLSSLPLPLTTEEDPSGSHQSNPHPSRYLPQPSPHHPFFAAAFAGGRTRSVAEVQAFHAHIAKTPALHSGDPYFANCLADAYRKAGSLDSACHLLDEILKPNAISWNLTISIHNQCSRFSESLHTLCAMREMGLEPTEVTYGSVLSACAMCGNARFGRQVHGLARKNGFLPNGYVTTGLVDLFAKTCNLDEAVNLFLENPTDNVVVWNAVIAGGARNGEHHVALYLFHQMIRGYCTPNEFTLSSVLTACTGARELELGRGIHGWVIKCAVGSDVVIGTALIDLYAKCGHIDSAVKQFLLMPMHNVVSWTSMISAFVQEDPKRAVSFFKGMITTTPDINKYTVTSVLAACGNLQMVKEAVQLHSWVLKSGFSTDPVVRASLLTMYVKTGENEMSGKVFEEDGVTKDVASWAAMISGLVQNESSDKCFQVFRKMNQHGLQPDKICCCSLLSIINYIGWGKQMHSYIIKAGLILSVPVASALFTMYSKCDSLDDSYMLFKQMPERDGVAWTSMIAGLTEHEHAGEALQLFREMIFNKIESDQVTLSHVITACAEQQYLTGGKEIHGHAVRTGYEHDVLIGGALISMYFKCKFLKTAVRLFHWMPHKDQFSWSCMVPGYAQNGYFQEALLAFQKMLVAGFKIDHFSCSSVIVVCADLSRPILGKQLHAQSTKAGMLSDLSVSSALVTMYSKCGSISSARKVFDQIEQPDLITWSAMIDGYSQNGKGEEALGIYGLMISGGTKPDSQTFVSLLSACSHDGLVEEGFLHFNEMAEDYGIEPEAPHYACMVDLLGRSGRLKEAVDFIHRMPVEPCKLIWSTLLGACRVHGDVELGRLAAQKVLELEPSDSGAYISLSNISADLGDWKEALKIRTSMRGIGVKKEPGWSSIG